MSPPRFEDLFKQADALVAQGRQADLRRAISAAYYGLFHFVLTEAADMVVGNADQSSARYSLVYRSVDHKRLLQLSAQLTNPQNLPLVPPGGLGPLPISPGLRATSMSYAIAPTMIRPRNTRRTRP